MPVSWVFSVQREFSRLGPRRQTQWEPEAPRAAAGGSRLSVMAGVSGHAAKLKGCLGSLEPYSRPFSGRRRKPASESRVSGRPCQD